MSAPVRSSVRDSVLDPLLPTAPQTTFLRACVARPTAASQAWTEWSAEATRDGTPIIHALEPFSRFLPVLSWNLARAGVRIDNERLSNYLHAGRQAEAHRWLRYRLDVRAAFAVLSEAQIPFIALKGVALSETIYPSPTFRPKADIDVWLRPEDLEDAAELFRSRGWQQNPSVGLPNPQHLPALARTNGYPLELHRWLLMPYYALPFDDLWARATPATLCGSETRTLSRTDALVHTIGHAMSGYGLATLPWVLDARFLVEQDTPFDWAAFVETTRQAKLGLACHTALRYLADEIGLDVPLVVLDQLQRTTERRGLRARAAARLGARPWAEGSVGAILRMRTSWPTRLAQLWQRIFPPPVELSLRYDVPLWTVPFYYVLRIVRYTRAPRA